MDIYNPEEDQVTYIATVSNDGSKFFEVTIVARSIEEAWQIAKSEFAVVAAVESEFSI